MEAILHHWDISSSAEITDISDGLINSSWKVTSNTDSYILQRINEQVFLHPEDLMTNHRSIFDHISRNGFEYQSPIWLAGRQEKTHFFFDNSLWRLGTFFEETKAVHQVADADMSWKVGRAFGAFDKALSGLSPSKVKDTIDQFHDAGRYVQQLSSIKADADPHRLKISEPLLDQIDDYLHLLRFDFPKNRVIHNDAKISNLLFKNDSVYAVIDWDTTMGGHISWEFADLFRTSAITVTEDHPEVTDIELQYDMIEGLSVGFKSKIYDDLSDDEQASLYQGTLYLIFEQAIRFLKDYLEGDIYYRCDYDDHNFVRSRNQFHLLSLLKKDKRKVRACIDSA